MKTLITVVLSLCMLIIALPSYAIQCTRVNDRLCTCGPGCFGGWVPPGGTATWTMASCPGVDASVANQTGYQVALATHNNQTAYWQVGTVSPSGGSESTPQQNFAGHTGALFFQPGGIGGMGSTADYQVTLFNRGQVNIYYLANCQCADQPGIHNCGATTATIAGGIIDGVISVAGGVF